MPKSANQRLKLLYIYQILFEQTDEEHPMSTGALIDALAQRGIQAERKSVYSDLELLRQFGADVISVRGKQPGHYIGARTFELAEVKLLVDLVQASKFLTRAKSTRLIGKLETLCSRRQAANLHRQVFVSNRVKTMNESIYYTVDLLHTAILRNRQITFRYFQYTVKKERAYRKNGGLYTVSPFALTWDDENYYLIAYDAAAQSLKHYRVDKMTDLQITDTPRQGIELFENSDPGLYAARFFSMYNGEIQSLKLRFSNRLVGVVIDRFGKETTLMPDGPDAFCIRVQVAVSPQFYGWLAGLGPSAQLIEPAAQRTAFCRYLQNCLNAYPPVQD